MQVYTTEIALLNIVNLGASLFYKPSSSPETVPYSTFAQFVYQVRATHPTCPTHRHGKTTRARPGRNSSGYFQPRGTQLVLAPWRCMRVRIRLCSCACAHLILALVAFWNARADTTRVAIQALVQQISGRSSPSSSRRRLSAVIDLTDTAVIKATLKDAARAVASNRDSTEINTVSDAKLSTAAAGISNANSITASSTSASVSLICTPPPLTLRIAFTITPVILDCRQ